VRGFCIVALIGLVLRVWVVAALHGYVPPYDPAAYMELARHLDTGTGLWRDSAIYGNDLRAFYPPLYPLLLGAVGLPFGVNPWSVALLNAALDACTALIVFRLAKGDLLGPALLFLWPTVIFNSAVAQKESLCMLLAAALAWLFVNWTARRAFAFGIAGGLLALSQPALAAFPAFLCLMLPVREWKAVPTACAAALLTLAPWIVRNALVLHDFVPLTTAAGFSLNHVLSGEYLRPPASIMALPEAARSMEAGKLSLQIVAAHPVSYVLIVIRNAWNALLFDSYGFSRAMPNVSKFAFVGTQFLHLLLLGAVGVGVSMADRKTVRLAVACGLTLLTMFWFEFGERHRYFLYPMLALLAADGIVAFERWRRGSGQLPDFEESVRVDVHGCVAARGNEKLHDRIISGREVA
jgi:hypothetical protein